MSPDHAIAKLQVIQAMYANDPEVAHSHADEVLCDLLTLLGYADVVAEWRQMQRWYA